MATNGGSVFSETLQAITNTKLEELSKRRAEFEAIRANVISRLEHETDPLKRLGLLSRGVKESYAIKTITAGDILSGRSKNSELELELKNLDSFIAQARYDPSITPHLMRSWEESLLRHLNTQSSKFEYASLYAQLVTEWLSTEKAAAAGAGDDVDMKEDFEDVGDSMKTEARRGWEKVVFEPAQVDVDALKAYLLDLFGLRDQDKPAKAKAFEKLRSKLANFENTLAAPGQFNSTTLTWVINGLLASDLLSDERREVLRDFLGNATILAEVADVLNMRLAALSSWSWGESVALEQQRKITGVYNVLMHEDVLQAVFLHYIGVKWSVFLKGAFREFRKFDGAWKSSRKIIRQLDQKRRVYYLGPESVKRHNSLHSARDKLYRQYYFMAGLMGHDAQQKSSLEGEEEANYAAATQVYQQQQQQMSLQMPPPMPTPIQQYQMRMNSVQKRTIANPTSLGRDAQFIRYDPSEEDEDSESDSNSEERRPMQDKQRLLRLLSTEIAIDTKLHGEVTAFHSAFESWNSLLPHETIATVMALLGVSETWIAFFTKFLRAPLKFLDDSPETAPRIRRRGTPAAHVLSEVFGESILFCLDFAVNEATGGHSIYRMNDDFWFWSPDHGVAKTAWKAVSEFANATRTYINTAKSGTVRIARDPSVALDIDESLPAGDIRWGFLKLSTSTGRFEIDEAVVDRHIVDLRRQLADKRKSIIAFIQTWNTFAATFFTSNFGQPANCYGRAHVDQILATHARIQREVFASPALLAGEAQPAAGEPITNVVDYLKHLLRTRFGVSADAIPDAYLFFPIELGGLDLRSPFISTLPLRQAVLADPGRILDTFLEAERAHYAKKKLAWERGGGGCGSPQQYAESQGGQRGWEPQDPQQFLPFEEYVRHREDLNYGFQNDLASVFRKLLEVPAEGAKGGIREASAAVRAGIQALAFPPQNFKGITGNWHTMDPYWRWVAQLYGPEAIRCFGGLSPVFLVGLWLFCITGWMLMCVGHLMGCVREWVVGNH
ncbi:hypothetical protein F5Y03DRAFT_112400 [Xylaria venustula]|nr:hypothetical protein F5Y03DRAFT_112400 [Xylaria venustula]